MSSRSAKLIAILIAGVVVVAASLLYLRHVAADTTAGVVEITAGVVNRFNDLVVKQTRATQGSVAFERVDHVGGIIATVTLRRDERGQHTDSAFVAILEPWFELRRPPVGRRYVGELESAQPLVIRLRVAALESTAPLRAQLILTGLQSIPVY